MARPKRYGKVFKRQATELVVRQGQSQAEVAGGLG